VVARKVAAVSVMVVSEAGSVMAAACPTGDGQQPVIEQHHQPQPDENLR
jgi:hypothetical protein